MTHQLNDVAPYSLRKKHQRGGCAILVVNNSTLKSMANNHRQNLTWLSAEAHKTSSAPTAPPQLRPSNVFVEYACRCLHSHHRRRVLHTAHPVDMSCLQPPSTWIGQFHDPIPTPRLHLSDMLLRAQLMRLAPPNKRRR
jgi:hypothetical protein